MNLNETKALLELTKKLLASAAISPAAKEGLAGADCLIPMAADGSSRRFFRLAAKDGSSCILCLPETSSTAMAEAEASFTIGSHLRGKGLAVPQIYGFDRQTGLLLFEDLGSKRLFDLVTGAGVGHDLLIKTYRQVLNALVLIQSRGVEDFDPQWCYDTPVYDKDLMLERESGYFYKACWQDLLGQVAVQKVWQEFSHIAEQAAKAENCYFLHRDCQSRNIMLAGGRAFFIDFQGGRRGPLGYDLASLLIDPYVALTPETEEELLQYYIELAKKTVVIDPSVFRRQYEFLALQRNLQILGAFSFLYQRREKSFFAAFIVPSLAQLIRRLKKDIFSQYSILRQMADKAYLLAQTRLGSNL